MMYNFKMSFMMNNKLKSNSNSNSRRCTRMTHPMISMICVSSMLAMMVMELAMLSTPVSAFLIDTATPTALQITSQNIAATATIPLLRRENYSTYHQHQRGTASTTITTTTSNTRKRATTYLQMAVTKSGGRPIQSYEQFQTEVLLLSGHDELDQDGSTRTAADTQTDGDDNDDDNANDNDIDTNVQSISSTTPTTPESFKPILVFYSAPWCGPCRLSNPVVKEIIRQFVPRIDVVEVCTDDLPEVPETAGVDSIPTIQIYYRGKLLDTIVGCVAKNVLSSAVKKILEDLGCYDDNDDAAATNGESMVD